MTKLEMVNEYFEKAKVEAELCETHAEKCKAFLNIAEFLVKYIDKADTVTNSNTNSNTNTKSNKKKIIFLDDNKVKYFYGNEEFVFDLDVNGIPIIEDDVDNEKRAVAYNSLKNSKEIKERINEANKKAGEKVIEEMNNKAEQTQQQPKANKEIVEEPNTSQTQIEQSKVEEAQQQQQQEINQSQQQVNNTIQFDEITKAKIDKIIPPTDDQNAYEIFCAYFNAFNYNGYDAAQNYMDSLVYNFSQGIFNKPTEINNIALFKPLVLQIQKDFVISYEYLQNLRNTKGVDVVDNIIANIVGNPNCNFENTVFENNVIFIVQNIKINQALGEFNEYRATVKSDVLIRYIRKILKNEQATIESITFNNVVMVVDGLNRIKEQLLSNK